MEWFGAEMSRLFVGETLGFFGGWIFGNHGL